MEGVHPLRDLAPRDTVVNEMVRVMKAPGEDHLLLDATHIPSEKLKQRFPTIYQHCLEAGIDITQVPIPVSPAAHYMSGGVVTDLHGRTKVRGFYACGETACTGVHGADGLRVVGDFEVGAELPVLVPERVHAMRARRHHFSHAVLLEGLDIGLRLFLKQLMLDCVGFRRSRDGLGDAEEFMKKNLEVLRVEYQEAKGFETQNMITLASLMTKAALLREESRGCHYRVDFPGQDEFWRKHIIFQFSDGHVSWELRPIGKLQDKSYDWSLTKISEGK